MTDYKKIVWSDNCSAYELSIRNVGNKNLNAQIQIVIDEYDKLRNRSKPLREIAIPSQFADAFIKAISEEG